MKWIEDKEIDWICINTAESGKTIPFSITQYVKIKAFQLKTPALICKGTSVSEFWSGSNSGYVHVSK